MVNKMLRFIAFHSASQAENTHFFSFPGNRFFHSASSRSFWVSLRGILPLEGYLPVDVWNKGQTDGNGYQHLSKLGVKVFLG